MASPQRDRRPEWRAAVLHSATLTHATKVVLLATLEYMRPDGKVCVQRDVIADELGVRRVETISNRWSDACKAGYLALVYRGTYGRPSTYQGLIPNHVSVRSTSTLTNHVSVRSTSTLTEPEEPHAYDEYPDHKRAPRTHATYKGNGHLWHRPSQKALRLLADILPTPSPQAIQQQQIDAQFTAARQALAPYLGHRLDRLMERARDNLPTTATTAQITIEAARLITEKKTA